MSCDGGRSWRVLKSFTRLITDFSILSENDFVVVGERGFISRTTDGGLTWSRTYARTQDTFNVIEFSTSGIGVAAGDFGLLMVSGRLGVAGLDANHLVRLVISSVSPLSKTIM